MTIIYPELGSYGRLGNQLWEIASTVGIASRFNAAVQFNRWDYEPYFQVPLDLFVDDPIGDPSWGYAIGLPDREKPYLQDLFFFQEAVDTIRRYFQPSDRSKEQLAQYEWFYQIRNKVALHIRRDERVTQFTDTHPAPPWTYYEKAVALERERFGDPTFCVFSDDIEWCKANMSGEFTFVEGYPRYQDTYLTDAEVEWKDHLDLFLMTDCVGHIIPNSTFSWWGAYLSNNPSPIYPAIWYGGCLSNLDWRAQIPHGWTEVGW